MILCRLCGEQKSFYDFKMELEDKTNSNWTFKELIEYHTRVSLEPSKLLPQGVCKECQRKIEVFAKFSTEIQETQMKFFDDTSNDTSQTEFMDCFVKLERCEKDNEVKFVEDVDIEFINKAGTSNMNFEDSSESDDEEKPVYNVDLDFRNKSEIPKEKFSDDYLDEIMMTDRSSPELSDDSQNQRMRKKIQHIKRYKVKRSVFGPEIKSYEELFKDEIEGNSRYKMKLHLNIDEIFKLPNGEIQNEVTEKYFPLRWQDLLMCAACKKQFNHFDKLEAHGNNVHGKGKWKIMCTIHQNVVKKDIVSFINYMLDTLYYEDLRFCCFVCSKMFYDCLSLVKHYRTHGGKYSDLMLCYICGYVHALEEMKIHKATHVLKEWTENAQLCEKMYHRLLEEPSNNIINPLVAEDERLPGGTVTDECQTRLAVDWSYAKYDCRACVITFETPVQLFIHSRSIHLNRKNLKEIYICKICEKRKAYMLKNSFNSIYTFLNHSIDENHHGSLKFSCLHCSKIFWNSFALTNHYRNVHPTFPSIFCNHCCKVFKEITNSARHYNGEVLNENEKTKKKQTEQTYVCHVCAKVLCSKFSFSIHMQKHEPANPDEIVECDSCAMEFRTNAQLKKHRLVHMKGLLAFECDKCGKKFDRKFGLQQHIQKVHENLRPFHCSYCDKSFNVKAALQLHTNSRHLGYCRYKCTLPTCGEAFTNWDKFYKHSKDEHGIDVRSDNYKRRNCLKIKEKDNS
ncbi:CLUMA_CG005130, isoform A [Clunio marinus]|uniref:CLUMA_CG005130, isoform A n=1 Tax=Clunio marinus TaxID=568069 RepID=A0A1J1HTS1_9DIPT|nr:CLUMA_CG005130, isoform A [Clunio marinus]